MIISETHSMGSSMTELNKMSKNNPENNNINLQTGQNIDINNEKISKILKPEKILNDNDNTSNYKISINQNLKD